MTGGGRLRKRAGTGLPGPSALEVAPGFTRDAYLLDAKTPAPLFFSTTSLFQPATPTPMPTLRNCVKCGEHIVVGDRFCAHCGAEQPATLGGGATEGQSTRWDDIEKRLKAATEGRYHIRGIIGRGGMAAVYLADWPQMELRVAIKVMDPYLLDQETFVQRFLQEARTIARLKHRHIIRVYDSGQFGDLYYFCMDYFPGRSLEKVLAEEGPLPVAVVKLWLSQAADALGYAHRQPKPIVHRDVKPSNILLDSEGDLVITDFGIAKVRDVDRTFSSSPSLTMPGSVLGTPTYLSPEQASLILDPQKAPDGGQATPASDQYALGVVAFEMLTGEPPFTGDLTRLVLAHSSQEPPHVLEKRSDCPPELADLVMRMLAKQPKDRWPSMHHLCAKLAAPSPPPGDPLRLQLMGYARGYKPVGSVSLKSPSGEIFEGQSFRLVATPLDLAGRPLRDRPLAWTSSDPDIAVVSGEGQVMVLRSGPACITATADGVSGELHLAVSPVRVDTVVVLPSQLALAVGEEGHLRTLLFSREGKELEGREVTWSSSDPQVARPSADGTVSGLRLGRAVITATSEGRAGTVTVEVHPVPVAAVDLAPGVLTLEVGDVSGFQCLLRDARGDVLEERAVTWAADDPSLVDLSATGRVVGLRPGKTTITAECGGVSGRAALIVTPEKVASLRISPETVEMMEGDSVHLAAVPLSARGRELSGRSILWESGGAEVAEVEEGGLLWGIRPGSAILTARCEGKEASARVTVTLAPVLALDLLPATVSLAQGDSIRLHAIPRGREGRELGHRPVSWSSSRGSVVEVDEEGLVRAVEEGEATVAAQCQGLEASARVAVLPAPVASVELPEPSITLGMGESRTLVPVLKGRDGRVLKERPMAWSSSRPEVLRVGPDGGLTALAEGAAVVTVEVDGVSRTLSVTVSPEPVDVLQISPPVLDLEEGEEVQLAASPCGKAGRVLSGRSLAWRSEDPSIASVSEGGSLLARSPGAVRVTVSCEGKASSAEVTVRPAVVGSVEVTPEQASLPVGGVGAFSGVVRSEKGRVILGRTLSWSSSDSEVAQVSDEGRVRPLGTGTAIITASCEGLRASATLSVVPEGVASLRLGPAPATLATGDVLELRCRVVGTTGRELPDRKVRWTSSAPEVASATASGKVRALSPGDVSITAACEGREAALALKVTPPPVASVRIFPDGPSLFPGESVTLRVSLEDERGRELAGRTVSWSSSNPKVARVDDNGRLEAVDSGTARVSARCEERSAEVLVEVKQIPVSSLDVVVRKGRIRVRRAQQLEAVARGEDGGRLKGRKVTWATSDPTVAEVDPSGRVRGVSAGSVRLTARCEGVEGFGSMTVDPPGGVPLLWLGAGGALAVAVLLAVLVLVPGHETGPETGSVTEPAPGTTGPRSDALAPLPSRVTSVGLEADRETVTVNDEISIEAEVLDEEGGILQDRAVEWRSSDPAVASVAGLAYAATVTARRAGSAVITASVEGVSGSVRVVVQEAAPGVTAPVVAAPVVTAIRITPTRDSLEVGATRQLRVTDQGGSSVAADLRSGDPAVASVSPQGLLRALQPGSVTVTANHAGITAEARFYVREAAPPPPPPTPSAAAVDSIRSVVEEVRLRAGVFDFERAYPVLDRLGAQLAELRARYPGAAVVAELDREYLDAFRDTYDKCEADRQNRLERGEANPPTCRAPPRGGGDGRI